MAQGLEERTASIRLAAVGAAVEALCDRPIGLLSGAEQLELLRDSLRLEARFHAWQVRLAAQVDAAGVASQEHAPPPPPGWRMRRT